MGDRGSMGKARVELSPASADMVVLPTMPAVALTEPPREAHSARRLLRLTAAQWTAAATALAFVIAIAIRAVLVLSRSFPLNDGALFLLMTEEISAHGFHLPASTAYNAANIPFAYSPLGFYLAAVLLILPLTDRFRASYVIGGCSAVAALSFLLFPFLAHDPWSAALLRFVAGLGLAGVYLPGVRVVAAASPAERRGLMVSIYVSAYYFGAALSLWASGTLLPAFGWRGAIPHHTSAPGEDSSGHVNQNQRLPHPAST